jgi:hypothetical protein
MKPYLAVVLLTPLYVATSQPIVYPLHVGDRWEYIVSGGGFGIPSSTRITGDTLMPNAQHYSIVVYNGSTPRFYERQAGNRTFRYNTQTQSENLWYDFSVSPGDTMSSFPRGTDTTDIILQYYGTVNLFGLNRRRWGILIDNLRHAIDDEQGVEIVDSLGLTDMTMANGFSTLRGAIINGVQYGTTEVNEFTDDVASAFELRQNFPNPFNPTTTIMFQIPMRALVTITIFDMLGRRVATALQHHMSAGTHQIQFDASGLSSGVYFYQMQAGAFVSNKRMLVVR